MEKEMLTNNDASFEIETLQDWESAKAEQEPVGSGGCSNSSNNTAE
jgi:hypothetical protein